MNETNGVDPDNAPTTQLKSLIALLSHKDGMKREGAREALVAMGDVAVQPLMSILSDASNPSRWEAAKALAEIGSTESTDLLIDCLKDPDTDIQWLAAEGLIKIGRPALKALLKAVFDDPDSTRLRNGAHHVLHDLHDESLRASMHPLLNDLQQSSLTESVQRAAGKGLELL